MPWEILLRDLRDLREYFKGVIMLKIKIEIGWPHIIVGIIALFIAFCLFVAWGLGL